MALELSTHPCGPYWRYTSTHAAKKDLGKAKSGSLALSINVTPVAALAL